MNRCRNKWDYVLYSVKVCKGGTLARSVPKTKFPYRGFQMKKNEQAESRQTLNLLAYQFQN
jgi:hypothetical protein